MNKKRLLGPVLCVVAFGVLLTGCEDDNDSSVSGATIEAMTPVCAGQGVAAAAYHRNAPGPHPTVLLAAGGGEHEWTDLLPRDWWPSRAEETQLVVCVGEEREVTLNSCQYIGGPPITRYRFERDVVLRAAATGGVVASTTLRGSEPARCPQRAPVQQVRVDGSRVEYQALEEWLAPYVQ